VTVTDDGANGPDASPGNNSASDTDSIADVPDLTLSKSDGGARVAPGGVVSYTLTVSNLSNIGAASVALTETVPAFSSIEFGLSSPGWICAGSGSAGATCTISISTLAGQSSTSRVFAVRVVDPLPVGVVTIANIAALSSPSLPAPQTPITATDNTPVRRPVLTIGKAALPPGVATNPVGLNDRITYTLSITNTGDLTATNVVLTDAIPPGTEYVAGTASPASAANSPMTWNIGTLAPGEVRSMSFAVVVIRFETQTSVRNVAFGFSAETPSAPSNAVVHILNPTAVRLAGFTAAYDNGAVSVRWRTTLESNTLGFNVYRGAGAFERGLRINSAMIPALGSTGGEYVVADATVLPGAQYWIEEIELDGATNIYGPASLALPTDAPVAQLPAQPVVAFAPALAPAPAVASEVEKASQLVVSNSQSVAGGQAVVIAPPEQAAAVNKAGPVTAPQLVIAPDMAAQTPIERALDGQASVNEPAAAPAHAAQAQVPQQQASVGQAADGAQPVRVLRGQASAAELGTVGQASQPSPAVTAAGASFSESTLRRALSAGALAMLIGLTLFVLRRRRRASR
jgi:uncharacterized repeat protein (TIGR01451 family)